MLDEPTTGLHFADIHKLLEVLIKLRDARNTLVIIEHNLEVIKCADWIIDLGPEGGEAGGLVICDGPPERVAQEPSSYLGDTFPRAAFMSVFALSCPRHDCDGSRSSRRSRSASAG